MRARPLLRAAAVALLLAGCRPHPQEAAGAVPEKVRIAARQGEAWAQTRLGLAYLKGVGAPLDRAQALHWLRMAAALHNGEAEVALSDLYERGDGVPQDPAAGLRWLRAAAADRWGWASVVLGDRYRDGAHGLAKDYAAAWACYRKASADDNVVGDVRMAFMTHNGFGVPKDDPLALKLYTDAANRDHRGWSSWVLGDNYYWGICRRDPALARMWLERAVFQGYRPAGLDLARLAENGDGQPEDPMLALAYYRCAAYSNDPETEREYGRVLYEGRLGPPDYAQAARQLSAAAQAGDATAAGILGAMMDQGLGLPKDPDGARRLWTQGMGGPGSWTWKGRPAVIARARRTPNMDGGLAAFQGVPKLRFDAAKAGPRLVRDQPGPGEAFRATAQLMRDDHNLYLGLDVTQREPPTNGGSVDRDLWDGDSAELFVCAKTELTGLTRGAKSYFDDQYIVAPTSKDGAPRILAVDHPRGGARVAVRRTRRGYTLCAAVPLADLAGLDWTPGSLIRFELSLAKAGKDGHRWARVFFNATGRASGSPDDWGEARVE